MTRKKQTDIKKTLKGYYESFQKDGEPISVNFRALVPELKKAERYTHLIHSTGGRGTGTEVNPESWTQLKGSNETHF